MYNNFAITSVTGRCGTKFLSNTMNKSKKWTVLHEPEGHIARFDRDFYGEVNSFLRVLNFKNLNVKKKGYITRNLMDLFVSAYNRIGEDAIKVITDGIIHADMALRDDNDIVIIEFEKMVSDEDYLLDIINQFGITDIESVSLKKVNQNNNKTYDSFQDIPYGPAVKFIKELEDTWDILKTASMQTLIEESVNND